MDIAIIGAGNVGSALAKALTGAGHTVTLGVRNPDEPEIRSFATGIGAKVAHAAGAASEAECIVLAVPWRVAEFAVRSLGDLKGKIVIDCMNPLGLFEGVLGLDRGFSTSGGETVAGWVPGARVVKTLNQVGAEMMAQAAGLSARPVMFMAGDDPAAKKQVGQLLDDIGFEALDAGDLTKSRLLEPLAMVWINQALARGLGRDWAFAIARRQPAAG